MLRKKVRSSARRAKELALADEGVGPLLQRDYWGVIRECRASPTEVMTYVSRHFEAFAPRELVVFRRQEQHEGALAAGDMLDVDIVGAGCFAVRVIHCSPQSFTLGTVKGHPEAGRITFGAYRNSHGDVIFHIRSRARSGSRKHYLGFLGVGESMQTTVWTDFVNRVAVAVGEGVMGWIHAETCHCEDEPEELERDTPTFEARGN